ncbi:hypothetical protein O6H91_05G065100 [Diphasiastrum complanatum]|uniref:Uncharacterized protein n=1 Tax=Diphasiastrum complanatum TaxID=34168 RepID=A0ACC2DP07_DIPCM|nr:hypothetical protein O6H91_Y568000 [Diphasiastrum complanatum]KAJ7556005.1 hypothetical protein O6H91_05G065100 [Diphasiastrum complanatum]
MGSGEVATPTKSAKAPSAQAYYSSGATPPPGYFPPNVALGPQPNPYMWGGQPIMPPYGTPPPYAAMYPAGGIYPSLPPGSHPYNQYGQLPGNSTEPKAANQTGADKTRENKEKSPFKKSKGSLAITGLLAATTSDDNKKTFVSVNDGSLHSSESGSEGSSDGGSEEGNTRMGLENSHRMGHEASSQHNGTPYKASTLGVMGKAVDYVGFNPANLRAARGKPALMSSAANLGTAGQDYWSGTTEGALSMKKGKRDNSSIPVVPAIQSNALMGAPVQNGAPQEFWCQDDREMKRQRRKQSNRESARRSRLRKQAECEELGTRVETLTVENMALHTELNRVTEERDKLATENKILLEQMEKAQPVITHQTQENSKL